VTDSQVAAMPRPFRLELRGIDPRYAIAAILLSYLVLGFTVLGFNRAPAQALVTTLSACGLEAVLTRLFKGKWIWPLSALITSFSLSILLNYSHDYFVLSVPVFFAIGSKYVFTFDGKHIYNPALSGVAWSLLLASSLITAAPAYQWNGIESMSLFMVMLAMTFLIPQVKRGALVATYLVSFSLLTALRAFIMRWHLPFETLFLGTLTSPAFFLFTFFMITDPATSPSSRKQQVALGVALAVVDLLYHLRWSYFTFFWAAFTIQSGKLIFLHARAIAREGPKQWFVGRFVRSRHYARVLFMALVAGSAFLVYRTAVAPNLEINHPPFRLERISPSASGIAPVMGDVLTRTDPRIHHVAKWLFSVGDSVAAGDFDGDGRQDLFFTFTLKRDADRNALYRNLGGFRFERVPLPVIEDKTKRIEEHGISTAAMFVDYDGDGDRDLYITYACGTPVMLRNRLAEDGAAAFEDVTAELGLAKWSNAMAANLFDVNRDGRLDLMVGNVLPEHLPGYDRPTRLDLFDLPEPEHEGDRRMFDFMHSSWHMSDNGGQNDLYLQRSDGSFEKVDSAAFGLRETMWSLAIGTGDFNRDGFTDAYVANDFGPDDLYLNDRGRRFVNLKGKMFGSVGRDTYKGMNASVGDLDNDGWLDIYVSNVHHALQAEGSLAWRLGPSEDPFRPTVEDGATELGLLNEDRFGWGATFADFDGDGWLDVVQANGMVDDSVDRRFDECPDYWYVNEKVARSPPALHRFADKWGDIRGMCIYGYERDRLYLNRGTERGRRFADVAEPIGLTDLGNSRGTSAVDLDDDGHLDLVITHQFAPPSIYRNMPIEARSWVGFELSGNGVSCNREAVGTTVRAGDQMREVNVVNGFSSQNDRRIHFGLGDRAGPVDIEISWCGGPPERRGPFEPGRYHALAQ
jgi:Na+-translocating ferredoxin:NAD+ oxidoreductase RnfD subunit